MSQTNESPATRVRLQDVADVTGVAVSTVSRVFSDPDRVSSTTRALVLRTAEQLGYRPVSGRGRATKNITVMVQDIRSPFLASFVSAVERQIRSAGYSTTIAIADESADMEQMHLQRMLTAGDGAIVSPRTLSDDELTRLAAAAPLVLHNREVDGIASVLIDTDAGSRQIIGHLASLGHTRIVYVAGPEHSWAEQKRWPALRAAATDRGIELGRVGPYLPSVTQGAAAAEVALAHHSGTRTRPTAIIAYNDLLAIGVMNRLRDLGIAVPREVSVVGYDDSFGSDFCQPPLTTVAGPIDEAGRLAASILIGMVEGTAPGSQHIVDSTLLLRSSTGPTS